MGKRDGLRGLKENVIVGRLIPAEPAWRTTTSARRRPPSRCSPKSRWRATETPAAETTAAGGGGSQNRGQSPISSQHKGALGRPFLLVHGINTSDRARVASSHA